MSVEKFLEHHTHEAKVIGFWDEISIATIKRLIESNYNTEIIRIYYVSDVVINFDKPIFKWSKRFRPLTDEELKEIYGR